MNARWREMQRIRKWIARPITRGQLLTVMLIVLLITAVVSGYLNSRRELGDRRTTLTSNQVAALRQGVCKVLDPIQAGQVAGVAKARAYPFPVSSARTEPLCRPVNVQPVLPRPTPAASTPAEPSSPTSTTVIRPTSTTVIIHPTPRPTVTRTKPPAPTHHPTHKPTASPCAHLLQHPLACLKKHT